MVEKQDVKELEGKPIRICTNDGRFDDEILAIRGGLCILKNSGLYFSIEVIKEEDGKLVAVWPA